MRLYSIQPVSGKDDIVCCKGEIYYLRLHKKSLIKREHLLPCYHKDFDVIQPNGTRLIKLGRKLGDGASRYVFEHPKNKKLIVKLDIFTYSNRKATRFDEIRNLQNFNEVKSIELIKSLNVKELSDMFALTRKASSNFFMIEQERVRGQTLYVANNRNYGRTSMDCCEIVNKFFMTVKPHLTREGYLTITRMAADLHGNNIMVTKKGKSKFVDCGFIENMKV